MAKQQKKVVVLARISWNKEDRVCYQVRSNKALKDNEYKLHRHGVAEVNGVEYKTVVRNGERYLVYIVCLINGVVAGCSCPSHNGKCYHKTQCQALEDARRTPVEVPVVVATVETRETDGLEASGLSVKEIWQAREKRAKAMHAEYAAAYTAKLNAVKQRQEVA